MNGVAVKPTGKTFSRSTSARSRARPKQRRLHIPQIEPMLRIYGKMTHIIFYADRTITIGFALGWATSPCRSSASRFTSCATASVLVGKLDPTYNIRMMGIPCCSFCPGIGDYHSGEC